MTARQSKFDTHAKAYVCTHVFDGTSPVTLVTRPEGDWCFLCGQVHDDLAESYRVVGIGHVTENDPSLSVLSDLEPGWEAERNELSGAWIRTRIEPDA
jgi:hypothetical protein